jgi:excisionase family DNA binding protein
MREFRRGVVLESIFVESDFAGSVSCASLAREMCHARLVAVSSLEGPLRVEDSMKRTAFDDEMLTIDEVAKYLKLRPQTIYKWAQTGRIPGAKIGKEWRFRRSSIEKWIDQKISTSADESSRRNDSIRSNRGRKNPHGKNPRGATKSGPASN